MFSSKKKLGITLLAVLVGGILLGIGITLLWQSMIRQPKLEVVSLESFYDHSSTNLIARVSIRNTGTDGWTKIYAQVFDGAGNPLSEKQSLREYFASGELRDFSFTIPATWQSGIPVYARVWGVPD